MVGFRDVQNLRNLRIGNTEATNPFGFFSWALDLKTITRYIRCCGQIQATEHGKSLHSQLIKHGSSSHVFIANNLIAMYSDFKLYDDAQQVFNEMTEKNVVSWTASISAHTHSGNPTEALRIFTKMLDYELEEPNSYTFSAALKACALVGNLELGRWIHKHVLRAELQSDTVLMNTVLDMYIKCGSLGDARKVFDGTFQANTTSWNTMIAGYSKEGNVDEAETLFYLSPEPDAVTFNTMIAGFAQKESPKALHYVYMMHKHGIKLDHFTFPSTLKICGSLRFETKGKQIHGYVIKSGLEFDCITGSSLLDMYSKCGQVNEAIKIFDKYSERKGTIFDMLPLWNSMVSGFAINEHNRPALDLISEIHSSGIGLDVYTLSSALKVCINLQNLEIGHQVHCIIITSGYHLDHVVGSVLVDLYAKCGNLEDALRLFLWLPHKDVVSWTGLITSYVQQGSNQLAFSLFRDMINSKIEVDHFIVSSVLKACSVLAGLGGGKQVHAYCIKGGFNRESVTVASLTDMYSKCGDIEDGLRVFKTAIEKDTVSWTAIIVGCGHNGRAIQAIELFHEMLNSGEEPNEITFLGILSACRHAGLVGEACTFFKAMGDKHGMTPCLEHYCCMVDILSRAGRFEEVKKLISDMPYEPDEIIWNSLLGACVVHQDADLGKLASEHLLPVSLCDTSVKLREAIRRVDLKEAGRSWLEVRA